MLVFKRLTAIAATISSLLAGVGTASAGLGQPSAWQLNFQQAGSPVMDNIISFHNFLLVIITLITLFVLALLVIIMVRFNARANPTPSRTTHNTLLEVAWTLVPVAILVMIAIPSFKLLFYQLNIPQADLTVKATGKQWYWNYSYPDNGKFEFDSLMVRDEKQLLTDQPRLLGVDNELVVPVNKTVRVQTTGAEVIHSFAVPSFGIRWTPFRVASTRPGLRRPARASTTANARSCAARTMHSCRSRCEWSARKPSQLGSKKPSRNSRATTTLRLMSPRRAQSTAQ